MKQADQLNYILGQYIGVAVNNGKKYPKTPALAKGKQKLTPQTAEEQENAIERIAQAFK